MGIEQRITQFTVLPCGEPIFSEQALHVSIDDEAAGEFVVVRSSAEDCGQIKINTDEWPMLREVIDRMILECRID